MVVNAAAGANGCGLGPEDAFGGAGAGQQILLVVPSLDLIVVRNGRQIDQSSVSNEELDRYVVGPVVRAMFGHAGGAYPSSPVIKGCDGEPEHKIIRAARQ